MREQEEEEKEKDKDDDEEDDDREDDEDAEKQEAFLPLRQRVPRELRAVGGGGAPVARTWPLSVAECFERWLGTVVRAEPHGPQYRLRFSPGFPYVADFTPCVAQQQLH